MTAIGLPSTPITGSSPFLPVLKHPTFFVNLHGSTYA